MPIFRCDECGCIENTALSRYWFRNEEDEKKITGGKTLCTGCHPKTKKWHGAFPQESAAGYLLTNDGFLCSKREVETESWKWREKHQGLKIVKEIT